MAKKLALDDKAADIIHKALRLDEVLPGVKAAGIAALFPTSGLYEYAPDEHIIEQEDTGKDVYVLCAGKVAIAKTFGTAGANLADLAPGGVFGEMALLRDGVRVATAAAQGKCSVFRLSAKDIAEVMESHPPLGAHLKELADKRSR